MYRSAFIAWWVASVSLVACRHYENITDYYSEGPFADAGRNGRDGGGRVLPGASTDGGGGTASSGGASGSTGPDSGASPTDGVPGTGGPSDDAGRNPATDAPPVGVLPPIDGPPATAPDAAINTLDLSVGLVSRWKLDELSGANVLDTGGNGNGGIVSGAVWEASGFPAARFANAGSLRFDGVDDYVELGTRALPANNRPQSVSFWFKTTAAPPTTGRQDFVSLTAGRMGASRLKFGFKEGRIAAWKSGTAGELAAAPAPAPGWHHFVYTFDGKAHRMYLDGAPPAMSTAAPDTGAVTRARLGASFDDVERFGGWLDDVRIYGRALTADEISALTAGFE